MLGTTGIDVPDLLGTVHPFMKTNQSLLHVFLVELHNLFTDRQARKILSYMALNVLCTAVLFMWCSSTNSMALTAYTYLTIFDFFSLATCLVTLWVTRQHQSPIFSFGYERFEVLAVFASTILAQFGALFIIKESVERMLIQPDIHTGRLLVGTSLAFIFHLLLTYSVDKRAFNNVTASSSSSWLQEHVTDISESLCHFIPGLAKVLLPRINPFALIACAGASALFLTHLLIDVYNYYSMDTWAAVWIALMTCGTMFPMSVYSGKILLQTTPSHIIGQLDKCLREASTLDGVLEFRHEHFWTVAFGTMAGSVHVRVRRDADEQMVLAHVYNRLSNLVPVLTVQIFKDDWSRPSAAATFQLRGDVKAPAVEQTATYPAVIGYNLQSQYVSMPLASYTGNMPRYAAPLKDLESVSRDHHQQQVAAAPTLPYMSPMYAGGSYVSNEAVIRQSSMASELSTNVGDNPTIGTYAGGSAYITQGYTNLGGAVGSGGRTGLQASFINPINYPTEIHEHVHSESGDKNK